MKKAVKTMYGNCLVTLDYIFGSSRPSRIFNLVVVNCCILFWVVVSLFGLSCAKAGRCGFFSDLCGLLWVVLNFF